MKRIYLDYASLTPIDPRVIREMKKFSALEYANPSSLYREGVAAKKALAEGRSIVARFLNAHPDEIIFTSGGTEANNLAVRGIVEAFRISKLEKDSQNNVSKTIVNNSNSFIKPHIVILSIEHSSIIEIVNYLEKEEGCEVTRLSVDSNGIINLDELKKSIKENTVLVSIMMVNNEIGSIQPIKEIAKIIRHAQKSRPTLDQIYPLFHTDAAQATYEEINMENLGVDLLTLDGGKVYGPRGIGALYVRRGTPIYPIIHGGGQEKGLRSGTENIPSIMGFAKALEILQKNRSKNNDLNIEAVRLFELKKYFIEQLQKMGVKLNREIKINGLNQSRVGLVSPHILNISIPNIDNEFFVLQLDAKGVACSTKSSCLRDQDESYVLKSIGANSHNSIRFSFGRWTKKRDLKKVAHLIGVLLKC